MRKGFNFFKSYFDVYNELGDKAKIEFIDALLKKQFWGVEPINLKGMANFAYISQKHSIDSQVKGYEDKTGVKLTPTVGGAQGGTDAPTVQVEEKGKGEGEEKGKEKNRIIEFPFTSKNFYETWEQWKEYKKAEHRFNYKSVITEQAALMTLVKLSDSTEQDCIQIIMHTIGNGWKGFVKQNTKNNNNGTDHAQQTANSVERLINKYRAEAEQEIGNA